MKNYKRGDCFVLGVRWYVTKDVREEAIFLSPVTDDTKGKWIQKSLLGKPQDWIDLEEKNK